VEIGKPKRKIVVEPLREPVPKREPTQPAPKEPPARKRTRTP